MGKGVIPTDHPLYVGNLVIHGSYAANTAICQCDVLFAIGVRFNDRVTGTISQFAPKATLIHIDIAPASIGKTVKADLPIVADAKQAIMALLESAPLSDSSSWRMKINQLK